MLIDDTIPDLPRILSIPIAVDLENIWKKIIPNNKKIGKLGMSVFNRLEKTMKRMESIKRGSRKVHKIPRIDDL